VEAVALGCTRLRCLDISACVRIKGSALLALADSTAVRVSGTPPQLAQRCNVFNARFGVGSTH
jgi:hypothetical protein